MIRTETILKKVKFRFIFLMILLLFTSCADDNNTKLKIFVSILPQKYFVERICGNKAEVNVMVGPGMNPANYEPLPKQMLELADAGLFFTIGVPFENVWLDKIKSNYPKLMIIDSQKGISLKKMESSDHWKKKGELAFNNNSGGLINENHKHIGYDPHTWLSPALVKIQAKNILDALCEVTPKNIDYYQSNYKKFIEDLDEISKEIEEIISGSSVNKFFVFHPSWGYFAEQFGLKQIAIEIEGKEPNLQEIASIIKYAKKENIKNIFVQVQFSSKGAEAVANEIDAQVISIDPLSEDYMNNLRNIATVLAGSE